MLDPVIASRQRNAEAEQLPDAQKQGSNLQPISQWMRGSPGSKLLFSSTRFRLSSSSKMKRKLSFETPIAPMNSSFPPESDWTICLIENVHIVFLLVQGIFKFSWVGSAPPDPWCDSFTAVGSSTFREVAEEMI